MAGQNFAGGIDEHQSSSPAAHAGLGILRVVIGHDGIDADASGEALLGIGDDGDRFFQLRARGQERGAVGQGPSVVLRVGDLDALGIQLLDEGDHLFEMIEILPVHDEIYGERDFVSGGWRARVRSCAHALWRRRSSWRRLRANPES